MEQTVPICSGFISVSIEVTFSFSGNGGISLAAAKKYCKKYLKDCACLMSEALSVNGFELQLVSSPLCTGFLIKSWLCQEVNGHYC